MGFGDAVLVGLPGEVFCEIGLAIKNRSPTAHCFLVSLVNDYAGYVPDDLAYDQGGYEPEWTPFERGSQGAMVAAAVGAARIALGIGGAEHAKPGDVQD